MNGTETDLQTLADLRHRGRLTQTIIYLGKFLRMFVYQSDWKVLPMSAVIAGIVALVTGANMFITQEGTLNGVFSLVCVCIWNGFFNSIQVVCRERGIIKREHRAGLHMSAYVAAQMVYQLLLCTAQTIVTLLVCWLAGIQAPEAGVVTRWGQLDMGITVLLITYTADMMALMVSSIVHNTVTAMTVMPFLLIFQLVFSNAFFGLEGFAQKITRLTISRWGMDSLCAVGRYNELPMVTLWNTLLNFQSYEYNGTYPVQQLMYNIQQKGQREEFLLVSGQYNQVDAYVSTAENVCHGWMILVIMLVVFIAASIIALEFIDRDKR